MTYCPKRRTQADRKALLGEATHSERRSSRKPTEATKAPQAEPEASGQESRPGWQPPAALWPVTC